MDALHSTLASYLGLSAKDVAELGGISERYALDLLRGRREWPDYLVEPLEELSGDVEIVATHFLTMLKNGREAEVLAFRDNKELRKHKANKLWPRRGKSKGSFIGPHRVAVISAWLYAGQVNNVRFLDS